MRTALDIVVPVSACYGIVHVEKRSDLALILVLRPLSRDELHRVVATAQMLGAVSNLSQMRHIKHRVHRGFEKAIPRTNCHAMRRESLPHLKRLFSQVIPAAEI